MQTAEPRKPRPMLLVAGILTISCLLAPSASDAGALCGPPRIAPSIVSRGCPAFREFTEAESIALGRAMAALRAREPQSIILVALEDAFRLRAGCRALAPGK